SSLVDCDDRTIVPGGSTATAAADVRAVVIARACNVELAAASGAPAVISSGPMALGAPEGPSLLHRRLSLGFGLLPVGNVKVAMNGRSESADTETSFALAPALDFAIGSVFHVGLGPKIIFNVKNKGAMDSAKQVDLLLRLSLLFPVSPSLPNLR